MHSQEYLGESGKRTDISNTCNNMDKSKVTGEHESEMILEGGGAIQVKG